MVTYKTKRNKRQRMMLITHISPHIISTWIFSRKFSAVSLYPSTVFLTTFPRTKVNGLIVLHSERFNLKWTDYKRVNWIYTFFRHCFALLQCSMFQQLKVYCWVYGYWMEKMLFTAWCVHHNVCVIFQMTKIYRNECG